MATQKRTRMYEPWGYREENNYQGNEIIIENDLTSFFADVEYKRSDNKIHFSNKDGREVGTLNVDDFVKSDQIVEKAWYEDGKIYIKFTNGDLITIDVKELIDENEFTDGLQVIDGVVSVLKDPSSERWLTVSLDGVKVDGIQAEIDRLDERIDNEISRATSEESRIEAKLDAEITRSTNEDARLDGKIDDETTRAKEAEAGLSRRIDTLNDELDAEKAIREAADVALGRRIDKEIDDREADVDEEEARAKAAEEALQEAIDDETARATSAETALQTAIDNEVARATAAEGVLQVNIDNEAARATEAEDALQTAVDAEETRATAAESALQTAISDEAARATSAETDLQGAINDEATRAQGVEDSLNDKIDAAVSSITDAVSEEVADRKAEAVASAAYDESAKTINFLNANGDVISSVDATDFIKDGMVDTVKIENGKLVIVFNTDSGKEQIEIPLTDIFDPSNYYTKDEIDEKVSTINYNISDEVSARESGDTALDGKIGALEAVVNTKANTTDVNAALDLKADKTEIPTDFYTKGEVDGKDNALQAAIDANTSAINAESARAISAETDIETALSGKADADVVYTQEEVDELLAQKEAEMQVKYDKLKDMVLDLYYVNTYSIPTDCTLDTMLKSKNGDAKLTEDITTSTIAAGVTAKNIVKLSLGGKTVTFTGSTTTNPAMMFRNKQQVNIGGSGTIDAGGRVAVWSSGADCEITLSGTMFGRPTYITDRSGGELIYCELGTINITDGIFKNTGDDKRYLLNCKDANYKAGTAKIVVTGGKFYDFNPADNTAEGEHTNFLAPGYHVEESQDGDSTVYTVKKDA